MRNFLSFTFSEGIGMDNSREALIRRIERNLRILRAYKKPRTAIQIFYFFKNKVFETMHMDGRDSGLGELTGGTGDPYLLDVIYCTSRDIIGILRQNTKNDTKKMKVFSDARTVGHIIEFLHTLRDSHKIDIDDWLDYISNSGLGDSAKVEYLQNISDSVRALEWIMKKN